MSPFKSKAQMRKFGSLVKKGQMAESVFKRWLSETKNVKSLPERKVKGIRKIKKHAKLSY